MVLLVQPTPWRKSSIFSGLGLYVTSFLDFSFLRSLKSRKSHELCKHQNYCWFSWVAQGCISGLLEQAYRSHKRWKEVISLVLEREQDIQMERLAEYCKGSWYGTQVSELLWPPGVLLPFPTRVSKSSYFKSFPECCISHRNQNTKVYIA